MIRDDDWVQVAMENDVVVVELLIQLHHQAPSPPPSTTKPDSLPLDSWTVRQPRSKPLALNTKTQPPPPPTRSSPTTPLSWTSQSASGSAEDSGRRPSPPTKSSDAPRSKGVNGTITSKRPRKKKTLAELKEEEMLLMKERRHLKKELEAMRLNLENQRAINQNFKRLKIDKQAAAITHNATNQNEESCSVATVSKDRFSLPDLNIAVEEDL